MQRLKKKHNNQKVGGSNNNRKPSKDGIIGSIIDYGKSNQTVSNAFVAGLQSASLSDKVIVNGNLSPKGLRQYLFSIVLKMQDFINVYILPVYPSYAPTITATINIVNGLKNDATNQTIFAGVLISQGYVNLTSGTVPTLVVDYDSVQASEKTSNILNRYVESQVKGCVKKGSIGPLGPFPK